MTKFKEEFPELKDYLGTEGESSDYIDTLDVIKHCLSKKRVREAIEKRISFCKKEWPDGTRRVANFCLCTGVSVRMALLQRARNGGPMGS